MVDPQSFGFDSNAILTVSGISFLFEHDLSNLPSPAEASNQLTTRKPVPTFGIMLSKHRTTLRQKVDPAAIAPARKRTQAGSLQPA
jgi:hypothetical protein